MSHYNRYNPGSYKRKYNDDYEGGDYTKRARTGSEVSVVIDDEVESQIFTLGEQIDANLKVPFSIENLIEKTAANVSARLLERRVEVMNALMECASKVPDKLSVYTTFVGLLNVRNQNFVEDFINSLATTIKENLKQSNFYLVHRLIRFVSDLTNVNAVSTRSILGIYKKFAELTLDTESPQVRTDFYVYCILSSISWNAKLLYEKHGPDFDEILDKIKNYLGKRHKEYFPMLKVWSTDDPHPQEEYLDCLWIQIKKLEDNDWSETQLHRPYTAFETLLATATPHEFPSIHVPDYDANSIFPLPRVIFRMFDYTDVPEEYILPGAHSIERYLVEEQLHSVINTYSLERKICATRLLSVNVTSKIPLNYMIVEVIFSQLFSLPRPPHIELFYGALLIELCKLQPNFMPQVLAQATEILYERIDSMKTTCVERFSSWFAYHLSNFQFKWSWEDWKESAQSEDLESPRNKFLRETLIRCMRLSYHQRVVDFMPESMVRLVPENPKPLYRYVSDEAANLEGTGVANRLLELFKERAIPEDVFQVLRDIPDKMSQENEPDSFNPLKIEVFTSTLLYFGNKSFSHAFAALAKYHMIFKMLVDNERSQIEVLKALHDVWKNHQQMIVVLVDKMLKTQIVECASVAEWIFSESMRQDLTSFYVWEILHASVSRMNKQVDKLQHEYNQMNEKFKKSSLEVSHCDISEEELESKLHTLTGLKEAQKKLFLVIEKRFAHVITDYLSKKDIKVEEGEKAPSLHWLKWISEHFENFMLAHNEEILPSFEEHRSEMVNAETHKHIVKLYKMLAALKK